MSGRTDLEVEIDAEAASKLKKEKPHREASLRILNFEFWITYFAFYSARGVRFGSVTKRTARRKFHTLFWEADHRLGAARDD